MNGQYQNEIKGLSNLPEFRYENIFKMFKVNNKHHFFNIIKSVSLPDNLDPETYTIEIIQSKTPWTILSHKFYNTMDLWWLICLANNIDNPVLFPEQGTSLRIIKPDYVRVIVDEIKRSLK